MASEQDQDVPMFFVGERFETFNEFNDKLNKRIMLTHEKVVKKVCKTIHFYNKRNILKKFREDLQYKLLIILCKHSGTFKTRGSEIRKTT